MYDEEVFSSNTSHMASFQSHIHSLVLLNISDREETKRAESPCFVGCIVGTGDENRCEILYSFDLKLLNVKTNGDDSQISIDISLAKRMFALHQAVYSKHQLLGWYLDGEMSKRNQLAIHEAFLSFLPFVYHLQYHKEVSSQGAFTCRKIQLPIALSIVKIGTNNGRNMQVIESPKLFQITNAKSESLVINQAIVDLASSLYTIQSHDEQ